MEVIMKIVLPILMVIFSLTIFTNNIFAYPISNGLVSYWQFNNNGTDKTGRGHDGQLNGDASYTYANNNFKQALYLDGDFDYFSVPDHADFDFTTSFTAVFWINPIEKNENVTLLGKWKYLGGNERAYLIDINSTDNIQTIFNYSGGSTEGYSSNVSVTFNQWQQIAVVYNGSTVTVYKNATAGNAQSTSSPLPNNPNDLLLGAYNGTENDGVYPDGYFYQGYIDEVKLFDRALSSSEILQDYQYVTNGIPDDPSTIPEPLSILLLGIAVAIKKFTKK